MTHHTHLIKSHLTFSVTGCKNNGKEGDKNVYIIDVVFDRDRNKIKKARFKATAGSEKVALQMIEALGQQTHGMDVNQFNLYKSKKIVFRGVHNTNEETHRTTLTIYKNNRAHNRLVNAFVKPGYGFIGPHVTLTREQQKEIDREVRLWAPFKRGKRKKDEAEGHLKFELKERV